MAFYIVVKGNITNYDFKYLDKKAPARLNKTIISSNAKGLGQEKIQQNNEEVYAIELMSTNLHKLSPANKIQEAAKLMQDKKIHHIPIMVDNKLTGVISNVDLKSDD